MVRARGAETTRIVWNHVYEEYQCERCRAVLFYDFAFRVCPYCGRRILRKRVVERPAGDDAGMTKE